MKIRYRLLLCSLCLLCLLSGCSMVRDRDYLYVEQHDEQYEEDLESDSLTVENYYGLRSAILSFVESGTENGLIRSYSYDGDIESDLEEAAYEITRSDPLGAWAVDYMTHDCNRIVSYYEITISITFRRTPEQIASLVQASSMEEAESLLVQTVEECGDFLAIRLSYTSELDPQTVLEEACLENPLLRLGSPSVSMQIYPESGVQRILEFSLTWEESEPVVTTMREQAQSALDTLSRFVTDSVSDQTRMAIYFRRLCIRTSYDPDIESSDVYDALLGDSSGSQGIAEAFYLLCTQNGLECSIISGQKNGQPHWWNLVTLDGQVYHVDVTSALEEGTAVMTLYYDEDLYSTCSWDTTLYPASTRPEEPEEEEETEETEETEADEETETPEGEAEESAPGAEAEPPADGEAAQEQADGLPAGTEAGAAEETEAADSDTGDASGGTEDTSLPADPDTGSDTGSDTGTGTDTGTESAQEAGTGQTDTGAEEQAEQEAETTEQTGTDAETTEAASDTQSADTLPADDAQTGSS